MNGLTLWMIAIPILILIGVSRIKQRKRGPYVFVERDNGTMVAFYDH